MKNLNGKYRSNYSIGFFQHYLYFPLLRSLFKQWTSVDLLPATLIKYIAENSAVTCLEEALYKISIDNTYGTEPTPPEFIITIDESSECSAQVDNTSGQNRVISIESTYRTANYNVTKTIQDITAEEWSIN
jgi:hypothetical protein